MPVTSSAVDKCLSNRITRQLLSLKKSALPLHLDKQPKRVSLFIFFVLLLQRNIIIITGIGTYSATIGVQKLETRGNVYSLHRKCTPTVISWIYGDSYV